MLLSDFFSRLIISSIASTGGTPFNALRRIQILLNSSGWSKFSSFLVPDCSTLIAGKIRLSTR